MSCNVIKLPGKTMVIIGHDRQLQYLHLALYIKGKLLFINVGRPNPAMSFQDIKNKLDEYAIKYPEELWDILEYEAEYEDLSGTSLQPSEPLEGWDGFLNFHKERGHI